MMDESRGGGPAPIEGRGRSWDRRGDELRIALVGSPRSGNTWLRGLLASICGLDELAVHHPDEVDWGALPSRCVVQIHWLREAPFVARLARHGFRVVVPARHPLDALISGLNYQQYVPEPFRWTDGLGGERTLRGATPRSREFLEYALSDHRGSVLSFSPEWWGRPGTLGVRYEDLVADAEGVLARILGELGADVRWSIAEAVAARSLASVRARPAEWTYHHWQGRPGLWRALIPARLARQIAEAQRDVLETLGYECDPDESLSDDRADANWYELQYHTARRHLDAERARHDQTRASLAAARSREPATDEGPSPGDRAAHSAQGARPSAVAASGIAPVLSLSHAGAGRQDPGPGLAAPADDGR